MDVKPWEPNMWAWTREGWKFHSLYWWNASKQEMPHTSQMEGGWDVYVTLANGQRIIVRALSEERKAARREAKAEELERLKSMLAYVMDSDPDGFSKAVSR